MSPEGNHFSDCNLRRELFQEPVNARPEGWKRYALCAPSVGNF